MKTNFLRSVLVICFCILTVFSVAASGNYRTIKVEAPFPMQPIKMFIYPDKDFVITNYGAKPGGDIDNSKAIAAAITACNKAGGGRVVIPAGVWLTGPIHFKSNVNLYLEKNAVLSFSDNPKDYLPAVMTSWEGLECYNYSPLLYAFECENIAITGNGTLQPKMETWKVWFKRPQAHLEALKELYTKASTDVPVKERQMAVGENNLRPHLIHFNRCKSVQLDGFKIRESPFWTIHLYMCDGGVVRNLDVRAHGHNNDGIDFEMSRNFLVEDCSFDQGDDAVVIKAGRNQDAWRLNTPCENIVIRNCQILKGHTLLGIGSEISGGIRNIYMHDCTAPNSVMRLFFVKTNHRRGGFIENIYMKDVNAGSAQRVLEIDTEVLYQWKDLVPTYEKRITRIDGIYMEGVSCESADAVYELKGNEQLPVENVEIKDVKVGLVRQFAKKVNNVNNLIEKNVTYKMDELSGKRIGVIGDSYVKNHKDPIRNTWHYKFAQKHGMKYFNYGKNGNSIAYSSPRWGEAMYLRYEEMADSLDYILVIGGHNDAFKLDSIGGIDKFKDKMEILCKGLVEKYPTSKIFFFTRWNCKDFKGSDSEKIVDAMLEVCGNYSIPILDCARKGGIYADNYNFRSLYFQKSNGNKDTAHLNNKGHDRFLKIAENFILQY